ncbi:MAG: MATE family efflux transporter [Lentisphaeria bacterium]|nr:MATE family efflux transporter [Lentisphaeria bacterium]
MSSIKAEYTHGPVGTTMLKTACAMLAGTLAMSGYNIADTFFVGQLGGEAPLAAMGFTFPVVMLVGCIFHGTGGGIMATMAHALGRNDSKQAALLVSSGMLLVSIIAVLLAAIGIASANWLFAAFGAEGETLVQVRRYMDVWYFGCFTAGLSMEGNKALIAAGKPKSASSMTILGMLVNIVLDPLFIFGFGPVPGMGIRGAAIATVLSQMVSAMVIIVILRQAELLHFRRIALPRLFEAWRTIIRYAIPGILGMLLFPIGNAVTTRITASFGDTAVAAVSAASRLEMVAFVFPMAVGITLMPMIAQNYGAKLYSRVRQCLRFAIGAAAFFLIAMGAVFIIFAPKIVVFFTPEQSVQEIMITYLRIIPYGLFMVEIFRFAGFAFTGCGRPNTDAWLKAMRIVGLHIPLSLLAMVLGSLPGLFLARLASDVLSGVIAVVVAWRFVHRLPADGQDISPA